MYHPLESFLFDAFDIPAAGRQAFSDTRTVSPNYNTVFIDGTGLLEIELPGVAKDRLQLDVRDNVLFVTGSRVPHPDDSTCATTEAEVRTSRAETTDGKKTSANGGDKEVHKDISSNDASAKREGLKYSAKFKLAYDADVNAIKAEFKDGLLKVRIPRRAEAEPKRLTVM